MNEKVLNGLNWVIGILKSNNIQYQVTGGVAASFYGSTREIYDIDIEMSNKDVLKVFELCREYVTFRPSRYINENFNLFLMTLEYEGQLIDLCGTENMRIKGEHQDVDLDQSVVIDGIYVVSKENLIKYKKLLGRDVDLMDIESITL